MKKNSVETEYWVSFKTPIDYWREALQSNPEKINEFPAIQKENPIWTQYDNDLHVYPYVKAVPAILSMGCPNTCNFCPTAAEHKGKIHFGTPELIIPYYYNQSVHFMDEDFFNNDMDTVLPLLRKNNITWLAMSTAKKAVEVLNQYGEDYLYRCGLRVIEVGLENVVLMNKVKGYSEELSKLKQIQIYYLNMTFLPYETKESIVENSKFMCSHELQRPIHFNNGVSYAPGQFYFPYKEEQRVEGKMLSNKQARTRPTYIPDTFLNQNFSIVSLEKVNFYCQLAYDFKLFPDITHANIGAFIGDDERKARWLCVGIRCGGIV